MSNTRKLKQFRRHGGSVQRPQFQWSGQPGNRTTQRQLAEQQAELDKPRFRLSSRRTVDEEA